MLGLTPRMWEIGVRPLVGSYLSLGGIRRLVGLVSCRALRDTSVKQHIKMGNEISLTMCNRKRCSACPFLNRKSTVQSYINLRTFSINIPSDVD